MKNRYLYYINDSFLWCTSQACLALLNLDTDVDSLMPTIKWLCDKQNASGGWSYSGRTNDDSHIIYSLYPAIVLKRVSKKKNCNFINQALQRLLQFVKTYKDGSQLDYSEKIIKFFLLDLFSEKYRL